MKMDKIEFSNVYFLKLGEKGSWENDLVSGGKARIGWNHISLNMILSSNWEEIKQVIQNDYLDRSKKTGSTQDFNALKNFCEATEDDLFITFHYGMLYWCFLDKEIKEDEISKYRSTKNGWSCKDIADRDLKISRLSGRITKLQGFRATLCKVNEVSAIYQAINNISNSTLDGISKSKSDLCHYIEIALTELNAFDCENLADLIFRQSGWQRLSNLGRTMKDFDLELEDPLTKESMQVQVKAKASKKDFEEYASKFADSKGFNKFCFLVFVPDDTFADYQHGFENVQLLLGPEIATLVVDLGLINWVSQKIST